MTLNTTRKIEWTDAFEQRLRAKLEDEYKQVDNMVVWAPRATKPLKEGGLIEVEKSANTLLMWIKKELGIMEED